MSRQKKENHANRFAVILLAAILVNLCLYCLPGSIFDIQIKKVDLLSDIRMTSQMNDVWETDDVEQVQSRTDRHDADSADELDEVLPTAPHNEQKDSSRNGNNSDADNLERRDQHLANGMSDEKNDASNGLYENATGTSTQIINDTTTQTANGNSIQITANTPFNPDNRQIEDFTADHTGLHRFFEALDNIDKLNRPVRIAFVGDSFIEGDILVADFRAMMQAHYGGRGVGFLPITSVVAQYRPTIKQSADGWKSYSIIKERNRKYVISGVHFEPSSNNASFKFQTVDFRPGLEEVSSMKVIYSKNEDTDLVLKDDDQTYTFNLPPSDRVTQFEMTGRFTNGTLQFKNAKGLRAYGIALEDNQGICVDNFALRGNSGIIMSALDSESCRELQQIRPYDLIILQYGLNVASDSVRDYSWYRNQMIPVVTHVQECFPGADVLILGISDRSRNIGGSFSTMPAVLSLLRAQRQIAQSTEVTFWSIFAAMGGENGMVKYVNSNWASKDYTHLNFNGGREIAKVFFDAIMSEKSLYDNLEKFDVRESIDEHECLEGDDQLEEREILNEHD